MKLNNINPCISKNYMLFATNSIEQPRLWSRANTSGRIICCNEDKCYDNTLLHKKLKYTILRYKENNGGSGIDSNVNTNIRSFLSGKITNRNYTRHASNTIELNNTLYYVDPSIKDKLINYLNTNFTKEQLKLLPIETLRNIMIQLKQKYNINIPENVLLARIPLSQYKNRYSYLSSSNNWNNDPTIKVPVYKKPLNFNIPYQCGNIITNSYVLAPFSNKSNNVFSILYNLNFKNVSITSNNIQFIYVEQNNTCTYTGRVENLFPAQNDNQMIDSASFWGSSILSSVSINSFINNGTKFFDPIFAIIQPGSWKVHCGKFPAKFGILLSLYSFAFNNKVAFKQYYRVVYPSYTDAQLNEKYNLYLNTVYTLTQSNSDLIFIPIQSSIGVLTTTIYPIDYLVNIPFVTDSINDLNNVKNELNITINRYLSINNIQYKLLRPYVDNFVEYINYS